MENHNKKEKPSTNFSTQKANKSPFIIILIIIIIVTILILSSYLFLVGIRNQNHIYVYVIYVRTDNNDSDFEIWIPIPKEEIIISNLEPLEERYFQEELNLLHVDPENDVDQEIIETPNGKALKLVSSDNFFLLSKYHSGSNDPKPSLTLTMGGEANNVMIYLNNSEYIGNISISILYSRTKDNWNILSNSYKGIGIAESPIDFDFEGHFGYAIEFALDNVPSRLNVGWNQMQYEKETWEIHID